MGLTEINKELKRLLNELNQQHNKIFYCSALSNKQSIESCSFLNNAEYWIQKSIEQHETQIQNTKRPQGGNKNPEVMLGQ